MFDQVGAITGPLIISFVIFSQGYPIGYATAFWIMWIPFILAMIMLVIAARTYPEPKAIAAIRERKKMFAETRLGKEF